MNNSDSYVGIFLLGIYIGILIFAMAIILIPGTTFQQGLSAIEECEQALPRNQHCIIKAIPETPKNDQ